MIASVLENLKLCVSVFTKRFVIQIVVCVSGAGLGVFHHIYPSDSVLHSGVPLVHDLARRAD